MKLSNETGYVGRCLVDFRSTKREARSLLVVGLKV